MHPGVLAVEILSGRNMMRFLQLFSCFSRQEGPGSWFVFHLSQMVETLYNNGANSIWEHSLLDPASVMSGRRKANPQDKVQ